MEIVEISEQEHDAFLKSHDGSLLQSSLWQQMKAIDWQGYRFAIRDNGEIIGAASILMRKFKGPFKIAYVPRGFVCDWSNEALVTAMVNECVRLAKEQKCTSLIVEPAVEKGQAAILAKAGMEIMKEDLPLFQPHYDSIVDISMPYEDYVNSLSKNIQRQIRHYPSLQLECVRNDPSLIPEYCRINAETEKRQGVHLRDQAYFEEMYRIFSKADAIDFLMVRFHNDQYQNDIRNHIKEVIQTKKEAEEALKEADPVKKKYKLLQNRIKECDTELTALQKRQEDMKNLPDSLFLSGTFVIYFGKTAYYLYAASSDELRFLRPSLYMNLEAIQDAQRRGCTQYNLGGVLHLEEDDGLMEFKRLLNGQLFSYEDIYVKPLNPLLHKVFFSMLVKRKEKAEKEAAASHAGNA